jgi:hypothetical protein
MAPFPAQSDLPKKAVFLDIRLLAPPGLRKSRRWVARFQSEGLGCYVASDFGLPNDLHGGTFVGFV